MASILGRITTNNVEILEVDGDPAAGAGTAAPLSTLAAYGGFHWIKIGPLDTDWDKVVTFNSGGNVDSGTFLRLAIYDTPTASPHLDDEVSQNGQLISVAIAAQPARSAAIQYTIPNPGDAVTAADFVLTEGTQTINGNKTFGNNVVVQGNFTVNGTLTWINSTNLEVTDPLVRLNKGGNSVSAAGSGLEIETNTYATVAGVLNANTGWQSTAIGTAGNGKTVTIQDSGSGGLSLISDNGSAVVIDLGGSNPNAATVNALPGLTTVMMTGAGTLTAAEGPLTTAGGTTGVAGYFKTSPDTLGWVSKVPSNAFALTLNQGNLTAARTQKYADTSGTFVMRPDGTPGVSGQIAYWQDANNLVSASGFTYVGGVLTVPNLTLSALGLGVVHSSASGVLSSSAVVLTSEVSGVLPIANGGTNSGTPLNNNRLMYSSSGAIVEYGAMQPNQVYFGAAGTGLPAQSANLFWDITNSRLGIGTTTPARSLDVASSSVFRGNILLNDATATKASWETAQAEVSTTDATVTPIQTIAVPTDKEILVEIRVLGRRTGGTAGAAGDAAAYVRTARFKNVAGTVTMHTLQTDFTSEDQKSWDATLAASGTNAIVRVTGATDNNIDWAVTSFIQVL